jgi:hypothetical protein
MKIVKYQILAAGGSRINGSLARNRGLPDGLPQPGGRAAVGPRNSWSVEDGVGMITPRAVSEEQAVQSSPRWS